MEEGNDGRWEVQVAFFPVLCDKLVFHVIKRKKTLVTTVIFRFYICSQVFIAIGLIIKKINWNYGHAESHDDTMSAEKPLS